MMYVRSSGNRPATTTPRTVFAPSLGRLRRRWPLGCWRPPPFDELLERREEEEKETEAREVRKRGCCCFEGVVWARVAVVVAVKIISLYSILMKRIRCCWIPFVCLSFVCFLRRFFNFFSLFLPLKTQNKQTPYVYHRHTLHIVSSFMCVSVRVCGVIVV